MSTAPSGFQTPKTNWQTADVVQPSDLNRIEGNINAIEQGARTLNQAQAPSGNEGSLRQILSWLANRIRAITGMTNWYDAPPTTLTAAKSHIDAAAPHSGHATTAALTAHTSAAAPHSGHETPAGAQAKAEAAAGAVRADIASESVGKGADMIGLPDPNNLFTATTVRGALEELFMSVSNGKSLIAGAITDKGVPTSPSDTFQVMANNINQIPVGDYSIGDMLPSSNVEFPVYIWSFTGHTDYVHAVAVDNDGYVYSGSYDYTVRKISPSGSQIWSFTRHTSVVYAVAVDNNGYVYSGSRDKTVRKVFDGLKIIA